MIKQLVFLLIIGFSCISCSNANTNNNSVIIDSPGSVANCMQGYVIFSLKVQNHKAVDPKIIESHPKGVFDKHAMKSIYHIYFESPDGTFISEYKIRYEPSDDCAL